MRAARVGLLALAFWPACTPGAGGVVERDSAGVRIVESHGGWDDDVAWTVSDVPTLEIGSPSGSPEDQLESIAVVRELRDGRIALADDRAGRIRVYDADGRNEWSSGRPGDGPGEYRLIAGLGEGPGDSLWVWDFTLRRFTILTADGSLARVARMTAPLSLLAIGRLDDGPFVMRESFSSAHAPGRTPGLQREPAAVVRISADGALLDTVLLVLGREYHLGEEDGRGVMSAPLFAHEASAALGREVLYVGDQTTFELGRYDVGGRLQALIRVPGVDLQLDEAEVRRQIRRDLEGRTAADRPMRARHLASMAVPSSRPAHGRILVDREGNLWAAEYTPEPLTPARWMVFDPRGRLLGSVRLPEQFDLHAIGQDRVLGVWRDELGLEYVRRYPLRKP